MQITLKKCRRHSEKHFKCVGVSLSLQIVLLLLTTSIPEGTGGSDDGDPAPGRSPGPPHIEYKASEESLELSYDDLKGKSDESVWCKNYFTPRSPHLNVTLRHPLFGVFTKLLPGLVYQVSLEQTSNDERIEEIYALLTTNDGEPVGNSRNESSKNVCLEGEWTRVSLNENQQWSFRTGDSSNVTFRFRYRISSGNIYEEVFTYSAATECVLKLRETRGSFGLSDLPASPTCRIAFPRKVPESSSKHKEGLLIELTRLNVPCSGGGFIQFVEETDGHEDGESVSSSKKLCGKLEELNLVERKLYFPSLSEAKRPYLVVHKRPVFALNYHLVDYCYNVTFVSRNGSLVLNPIKNLLCHFRVHLPYGNRVLLRLQMGEDKILSTTEAYSEKAQIPKLKKSSSSSNRTLKRFSATGNGAQNFAQTRFWNEDKDAECNGLHVVVWDGSLNWNHCSRHGDPKRDIQVSSRENVVTIKIVTTRTAAATEGGEAAAAAADSSGYPVVKFWYHAEPIPKVVGTCEFGEVLVKQFCVSSVQLRMDWNEAEEFCVKRGGHLASIRDEASQNIIDNLLINGPEYREHNSYWIGASDKIYEGYFRWSDGLPFSYSRIRCCVLLIVRQQEDVICKLDWFPGWSQQSFYNRQPNDDGFSHQDCVEIRRVFPHPSGSRIIDGITSSYLWNDLDCKTKNFFLCERLESGDSSELSWNQECNKTISLTREHPKATVVSYGFPHQYPDNVHCETLVVAPSGYRIIIDFEELVIEKEPSCSYDYLELIEDSSNDSYVARRLCDDMSDKLKLLRHISQGPRLKFLFVSDYSHHYGGFKARVSIENAGMECSDERYELFNNSCYLFVSYPKVTWETASQICKGMKAELAGVQNAEEESFITGNIRNSVEYTTASAYWLGGYQLASNGWKWIDGEAMDYTAWPPLEDTEALMRGDENYCLAVQWVSLKAESSHSSSGLYWTAQGCKETGGYVCKKGNQVASEMVKLNRTLNGSEGYLMSPGYPAHYYNNLDNHVHIIGPPWTRIIITFTKIDLEFQVECLYDFVEIRSGGLEEAQVRWCGNKTLKKTRFVFVSDNNEAVFRFHSDYSVTGNGFYANWKAVDISGCPSQKLTAREGIISSPNYGDFLLPRLDCTTIIIAPPGKRIWLEFEEINLTDETKQKDTRLELDLGGSVRPFPLYQSGDIDKGNFLSFGEKMVIRLKTSQDPRGNGFRAVYRTVNALQEERIVNLAANSNGILHYLNYPADPATNVNFLQHLIAPIGYVIYLELHQVSLSDPDKTCPGENGIIEVTDNYADENGTWWFLCETKNDPSLATPSLAVTSYLNTLYIRQRSFSVGTRMNATLKVKQDANFKGKLLKASDGGFVESCHPNPCQNGGKCVNSEGKKLCQCIGHFTGMFCALTLCELEPCLFGQCELTGNAYKCHCQTGYTGPTCDRKQSPCEDNPCEGRGECVEKSDSFHCRCHAWWEGPRCERRMMHIPFKPLSERMLQEPFWLGLITVFVVLAVIGLVWCAKRHFPEKLEKLLAEEADRNNRSNVSGLIRPPSVREPNSASGAVPVANPPGTTNCPRKLFGRLGIRKSSLLSLTSPQRPDRATSRTFSLDDLLRPTPRRTPSPRKKSSSSAPPKRNASEKKQILQHLICPTLTSEKDTLGEPIILKEAKRKSLPTEKTEWQETTFTTAAAAATTSKAHSKSDFGKLEKKVTFAKLLNRVSAEMNSSPELDASASNAGVVKALSTPVSPALERKFVQSDSTHHGSDSLSSSEIAISGSAFNSLLDIPSSVKKPVIVPCKSRKSPPGSDTVLEMFRNFASTSVSSRRQSQSTTPTASSPQDELAVSEESSVIDTPVSTTTTSGPLDSPSDLLYHGTTIEIPVMDALTAQKTAHASAGNNFHQSPSILLEIPTTACNKFLSPIREMPTPTVSPAPTPIMPRIDVNVIKMSSDSSDDEDDDDDSKRKSGNEEDESEDFSEVLIQVHREDEGNEVEEDDDDELLSHTDEESCRQSFLFPRDEMPRFTIENPVAERPAMIIPLLTVQEPSPPSTSPPGSFPGSPPPQKDMQPFGYSPGESPRRLIKGPDKPNSLDLPYPPPMITITCNVSEPESDMEYLSPAPKKQNAGSQNPTVNNVGMTYLSPFSMCSRGDRTASESNLSSSGYSSMASPGPSRCGSNNPLCLSEIEDQHSRGHSPTRYPSPHLRTSNNEDVQSDEAKHRGRSDSETLSDDPLLESNDEGIGTDHVDEKLEEKETKNPEVFLGKESTGQSVIDFGPFALAVGAPSRGALKKWDNLECITNVGSTIPKASLQLPTIVVQSDYSDKLLSPVSSRSESPLSDKALGLGRFSPMFYGKSKCDLLPFTDSDGLYDFPSSDCPLSNNKSVQAGTTSHRKSTGKRRERRSSHRVTTSGSKTSSPTKGHGALLEVPPTKEATPGHRTIAQRKPSPKRRVRTQQPLSSSSSTESLTSRKSVNISVLDEDNRWNKTECQKLEGSSENLPEDTTEDSCRETTNDGMSTDEQPTKRSIGFRTIGHQIRFLRRIELSLKRKKKLMVCADSEDEEDVEDPSLSLLPQTELKKSHSIGLVQQPFVVPKRKVKKRKFSGLPSSSPPKSGQKPGDVLSVAHGQTD